LNIERDTSSPYNVLCSQNNLFQYVKLYKDLFANIKTNRANIVQGYYRRDKFDNDLAFECLSFGLDFNFDQNTHVNKIAKLLENNQTLALKMEMYQRNFDLYEQELDRIVKGFQYQLVVYDESELFRQHTDSLFTYPYEQRKSILGKE